MSRSPISTKWPEEGNTVPAPVQGVARQRVEHDIQVAAADDGVLGHPVPVANEPALRRVADRREELKAQIDAAVCSKCHGRRDLDAWEALPRTTAAWAPFPISAYALGDAQVNGGVPDTTNSLGCLNAEQGHDVHDVAEGERGDMDVNGHLVG
ncbi:hypothetical protein PG984_012724 [Apiospora sp. TS-2023a]